MKVWRVRIAKKSTYTLFCLYLFTLQTWNILLKIDSVKERFKFSPTRNLFRLFKTIERYYLINLIKDILPFMTHVTD